MQLLRCDIYDSKDSEEAILKGILAYVESNGDSESTNAWIGSFPIATSAVGKEDTLLRGKKYLRIHDGRCGEIIFTGSMVEPSGELIIEFEGMGVFDSEEF